MIMNEIVIETQGPPVFFKEEEKPFKRTYHNCIRCMKPYSLGVPYDLANPPARDLCDDCIIEMDFDEFYAMVPDSKALPNVINLDLDNPGDRLKIIRGKLL